LKGEGEETSEASCRNKNDSWGSGSAAYSWLCLSKCVIYASRHVCTARSSAQLPACPEHGGLHYSTGIAGSTSEVAFWQERNCVRQNYDVNGK